MSGRLCFLACAGFAREVAAAIAAEGWDDVASAAFPSRCGRPPVDWDELRPLLPADCAQVVVLGRACLTGLGNPPPDFPPARALTVRQCFHLVACEGLVDEAISGGAYLMTPTWLADWRARVREMGFVPEQAGAFFHDFARELLLLDTGVAPDSAERLAELGAALDLPVRRLPVGLDHARGLLARAVLAWRLEARGQAAAEEARRHVAELADHVAAMDMLARMARATQEADAVAAIADLFRMLFAPAALHYLHVENGTPSADQPIPGDLHAALLALDGDHAWTPDGQGFLLRIGHDDKVLGLVAVERLAFPAYRERYLNMALAVSGVCGLAIDNARNHRRLLEMEKMASLGILVAGVAHEINTPLGVCLAAASTLQAQSEKLAGRFASRAMTQSDLDGYLQAAREGAALMRGNLERIGHLISTFRQVALEDAALARHPFRLRACVEQVIASLGDRLPAGRVRLDIDCDPELEVTSVSDDWVSIFVNLVSNSLMHGFKGRERGLIQIAVKRDADWLRLEYRDDGAGLSPEASARIFDPFFTTDLQNGTGLGMHLVYNIVTHRLNGSIRVESRPGEGVRFLIQVPGEAVR